MPLCCFEAFLEKFIENFSFLVKKLTSLETSTEILRKFVFLTMFDKWQILRKIGISLNFFFDQTSKRGQILTKTVFLPKESHILLNYAFLLFEAFLEKFIENFSF